MGDKLLAHMIHKCRPFVIHLNVRGAHSLTNAGFVSISGCRNIQDLNISECKNLTVFIAFFFNILRAWTKLNYLFMILKDDLVNIITNGCVILLYLNLSFNENLTDSTVRYLSK